MSQLIQRLPNDIENEIKNLVLTKSVRLTLLLDKYPLEKMETFLEQFSIEQLDRIYRYGCVCKIFEEEDVWCNSTKPIINEMFVGCARPYILFTKSCRPERGFRYYWDMQMKMVHPYKHDYIRRITNFCGFVLAFSSYHLKWNDRFVNFCEKLVYDLIVGSLIMLKNK
jgi:hypothetical protein